MSGIYIPKMRMPSCCGECRFLDDFGDYPRCIITDEQRGYTFRIRELRMPHCPLIPVPDHGDLIDREKMRDYWLCASWDCPNMDVGNEKDVFAVINAVPVVLPGEEKENDH